VVQFCAGTDSVVQRVAVCCIVLQCDAVYFSVLQRVAVCCSAIYNGWYMPANGEGLGFSMGFVFGGLGLGV